MSEHSGIDSFDNAVISFDDPNTPRNAQGFASGDNLISIERCATIDELTDTIEQQRETIEFLLAVIKDMMGEDNA